MMVKGVGRGITINPELESRLRERAQAAGITVETYIERIARDDQAAEEELEALAIEGLNSGVPLKADEQYWERKRRRLIPAPTHRSLSRIWQMG